MSGQGKAGRALRKDRLKASDRVGEVIGIIVCIALVIFFLENQIQRTGFFTSKFGQVEEILFYGSALFGVVTASARAVVGRKNPVRPLEVFGALLWAFASYWMLQVFPFDFAHFPDLLPAWVKFLLFWLNNDIARVLLVIGIIAGLLQAIYTTWLFLSVRRLRETSG